MHLLRVARLPSEAADIPKYGFKELVNQKMVVVAED
jgi:hypothetical protein